MIYNKEGKYVLKSPINGIITFIEIWSANQVVENDQAVFWIEPTHEIEIVGKLKLPIRKSGKVKKGQVVQVKLHNYPFEEFGMIVGSVYKIGLLPIDGFYEVDVAFHDGLLTTYGVKLHFQQYMIGDAEIITANLSLQDRLLYQMKKLTNKSY